MTTYLKAQGREWPVTIQRREADRAWNGRESYLIVLKMGYAEAAALFTDGLQWRIEEREGEFSRETDCSAYTVAGVLMDFRNGTVAAKMGKKTAAELAEEKADDAERTAKTLLGMKSYMAVGAEKAQQLRAVIVTAAASLDDKAASTAPELFPQLTGDGSLVKAGTRINWNGTVKRAAVDLWDTAENVPDKAGNLWEDIQYKQGYRLIPETISAGLAFSKGEKGWWNGELYESELEANVWNPDVNPAGWQKAEGTA